MPSATVTDPSDSLHQSIMQRANDIAHIMLRKDLAITVSNDATANGVDCTVIIAIGDAAAPVKDIGDRLTAEIARLSAERAAKADEG